MPDAVAARLEAARRAIACVTHARLAARPTGRGGEWVAQLPSPAAVRFAGSLRGCRIVARIAVRPAVAAEPAASIRAYMYAIEDADGAELVAFHLHPEAQGDAPPFPHLHANAVLRPSNRAAGLERGVFPLSKRHIPTGAVPLAAFARMLVEEFGAEPLVADWRDRLADAESPFG